MANIAIVILAAGNSSRMGQPKQLLDYGGKPLLRHAAEVALASAAGAVVVVCGQLESETRHALEGLPVHIAPNPAWEGGMGTSIQAGLRALDIQTTDGVIITLADMPLLTPAIYNSLIDTHAYSQKPIVTAEYAGTVGVPVLFTKAMFPPLLALAPNQGCKGVILAHPDQVHRLPCPEAEIDIDTPADYTRLRFPLVP